MINHKMKLFLVVSMLFLLIFMCVGCSSNPQSTAATASSVPPESGVTIRAQVVKLTQGEYTSVGKTGIENPSIDDFKTLIIGVNVVGINPAKERNITCPDIGEITDKLSSKVVRYAHSSSMDNDADSVVNYDNILVLHTKDVSNDGLKSKLKGLKIEVSYTDVNDKIIKKAYDVGEILQFV